MKPPAVPTFESQFPLTKVEHWADRYEYEDDTEVIAAGVKARERGWYTQDEFLTITDWKRTAVTRGSAATPPQPSRTPPNSRS